MNEYEYKKPENPVAGFFKKMTPKKLKLTILAGVSSLALLVLAPNIFETNNYGDYQVKQAAGTGTITVRNRPGMYLQMFGSIFTYKVSDEYYYQNNKLDNGDYPDTDAIKVRFNDGSEGEIIGMIKYRLSVDDEKQKLLHRDFKTYDSFKNSLIRQVVKEAVITTATYFSAESTYTTGRVEFSSLVEEQIKAGLYKTESKKVTVVDEDGTKFVDVVTSIQRDKDGNGIIGKDSPFNRYGVEVLQVTISDVKPDNTILELIAKKKEAEQLAVLAKQNAEKAKQDAITVREQGKAKVAKAEAEALILKKTAVIAAEKNRAVAEEDAKKALAEAKATKAKGEAEAYAAKLKVRAGLTPLERATIDKETAIGVAEKMSNIKFPEMLIIGGAGGKGGTMNPFDAIGLESFIKIKNGIVKSKK